MSEYKNLLGKMQNALADAYQDQSNLNEDTLIKSVLDAYKPTQSREMLIVFLTADHDEDWFTISYGDFDPQIKPTKNTPYEFLKATVESCFYSDLYTYFEQVFGSDEPDDMED